MKDFFAIILICLSSNFCISQIITRGCYDFPLTIEIVDSAEYENNLELIEQQKEMEISQICFDEKLGTITKMNEREGVKMKNLYKLDNKMYMIITKDSIEYFKTLYIQDLLPDLQDEEIIKAINTNTKEDSNDIKIICGIKCHKITRMIPHTLTFETYVTDRIKTNQMFLIYLPNGTMYKGTALEIVTDIGFAKLKSEAKNLITENIPDSIFIVDTLKLKPLSEMQNNDIVYNESEEDSFIRGKGYGLDLVEKMIADSILVRSDFDDYISKNASIDNGKLLCYLKRKKDNENLSIDEINEIALKFNLTNKKNIEDFNRIFTEYELGEEYNYARYLSDYIGYKNIQEPSFRRNLVDNLNYRNYKSKLEDNSIIEEKFINNKINVGEFLASLKGIYQIEIKKYQLESQIIEAVTYLIKLIEPQVQIKSIIQKGTQLELTIIYNEEELLYISDILGYVNYTYDENDEIIKNENDTIDILGYIENDFLNMMKQIAADLDLNKVYCLLKEHTILSGPLFASIKNKEINEFHLFQNPLLISIDKEFSSDNFFTFINFSFKEDEGEIGYGYTISSPYDADPGIEYVSIYKKREFIEFLKKDRDQLNIEYDQIKYLEENVLYRLIESVGDLASYIPQIGVEINNMMTIRAPNLSGKEKLKDIFPTIYKLIGDDFEANNFKIELSENELDYIFTFKAYGQNYKIETIASKLEIEMLKKIAQIMNQKKLYKSKKLYYEFKLSLLTLKAFYLTDETKSELEKLLSFELLPLK